MGQCNVIMRLWNVKETWNVIMGPRNVNRDLQCDYETVLSGYGNA